nr:class I SAM-dependent methyltransferase [Thalassobacillus cyri]
MGRWFPKLYNIVMKPLDLTKLRKIRKMLSEQAGGRVLEVGSGTGMNFPYYKYAAKVDAIEPNPWMNKQAQRQVKSSQVPIHIHLAKAEKLPFADNTFDTVVATLVFCSISDPLKAFREIKRVSKPGASILLLEHVKVNHPVIGKAQEALTPFWKSVCDGCHLNRDTVRLLKLTDLSVLKVHSYFKGLFLYIVCLNEERD